ncbi:MAG TPA: hypothetical protein VG204_15650 [Terriglobia bacterium]|nr:hypothetical protein [Terriglobia bacterium]
MPLLAQNLFEARAAYSALELRVQSAEQTTTTLQATVDNLRSTQSVIVDRAKLLTQYTVGQVQSNAQLTADQAGRVSPDLPLDALISSLGLAVALAEASMPDRALNSVNVTLQTYLTFDANSKVAGVRLYQPELGQPNALATTSFEIAKVAPPAGTPAPRDLYAVLQDKQSLFTNPFWIRFAAGTPPSQPAAQIVAEIAKVFANIGAWTLPFLVQEAAAIAGFETTLSALMAGTAPQERVSAFATVVAALSTLTKALDPATRSNFVAGDLHALEAALDATTRIAATLLP